MVPTVIGATYDEKPEEPVIGFEYTLIYGIVRYLGEFYDASMDRMEYMIIPVYLKFLAFGYDARLYFGVDTYIDNEILYIPEGGHGVVNDNFMFLWDFEWIHG